jgi:hypothetical protein
MGDLLLTAALVVLVAAAVLGFELLRMDDFRPVRRALGRLRRDDQEVAAGRPLLTAAPGRVADARAPSTGLWSEDRPRRAAGRRTRDAAIVALVVASAVLVISLVMQAARPHGTFAGGPPAPSAPGGGVAAAIATPSADASRTAPPPTPSAKPVATPVATPNAPSGPRPVARIDRSAACVDVAGFIRFDGRRSSHATGFLWDFGDGTTSSRPAPLHAYSGPGKHRYLVTLRVTGPGGTATATTRVDVPCP